MKLIETTVLETSVRMRYADNADPAKAVEWLDFQVANPNLKDPSGKVITQRDHLGLGALKLAALRHALAVIETEISQTRDQLNRIPS